MMLGQSIDLNKEPRPASGQELKIWNQFLADYDKLTNTVQGFVSTAEVAATLQSKAHNAGLPLALFNNLDQRAVDSVLIRYNTIGRLIAGCDLRKYWTHFSQGDVAIVTPPGMPPEAYQGDVYPQAFDPELGIAPLVVAGLIIGVTLITGTITTCAVLDYKTHAKDDEFRKQVLKADKEALKLSKPEQETWLKIKKSSSDLIGKATSDHKGSWFGNLLSSDLGKALGGVVAIGGGLLAIGFIVDQMRARKK